MPLVSSPQQAEPVSRLGRIAIAAVLVLSATISLAGSGGHAAAQDVAADDGPQAVYYDPQFDNVVVPGDLGQSDQHVYIDATGHTIRGYMLDYWRAQGAASIYGNPVSEPFAAKNGFYSQAFEGGVFQFNPDLVWTDAPSVSLMPVGDETLASRIGTTRRDGRRAGGGGDPRAAAWHSYGADSGVARKALDAGGVYDDATGHTITGAFADWYEGHEGAYYLGSPLTQPVTERGMVVQYFQGALLMRTPGGRVLVAPIIREQADRIGIDTTPVDRAGLPGFSEDAMITAPNPNPIGDPEATGRKFIEVDVSEETMSVYQGSTLVTTSLVSTGIEPNGTERGHFHVRYKLPKQDMAGTTGPNGEVVALGADAAELAAQQGRSDEVGYVVPDVPNVMYINMDAEAMHGAYWHNNFGQPMSHGCINLPLDFAAFLYGWAPLGTPVWVHD